jgi:hypothetical protein
MLIHPFRSDQIARKLDESSEPREEAWEQRMVDKLLFLSNR